MCFRSGRETGVAARAAALVVMFAGSVMLSACGAGPGGQAGSTPAAHGSRPVTGQGSQPARGGNAAAVPGAFPSAADLARAAAITATMSLPAKAGQLLVAGIPGTSAAGGGAALVRRYHLGGVIYFGPNIRTAAQVAALSDGLQRAATGQAPHIPLLIGTDQEGGIVSRLAGIVTGFPDQMAAGATRDPALIEAQEQATGRQLRSLGINLDYAPVADVNVDPANPVIGIRSFGAAPGLVSRMTAAAVAGFHAAGEIATAKHFPGHGDTDIDSHTGLPVIHHTLAQWWRIDAPPFQAAIRAGVDEMMIAHIEVPALDSSGVPASLSRKIITGLLRDRLGFRGVITTDSLQMGGVLAGNTNAQIAVKAIEAGADQLLLPQSLPTAYDALIAAVRSGRISMARLDASVTRIIALKIARGVMAHPQAATASAAGMNPPAARAIAARLARASITLVANRSIGGGRRALPLAGRAVYVAGPLAGPLAASLAAPLKRTGGHLAASPSAAQEIVVTTQNAASDPAQRSLVARLAAAGKPLVVVATGVPYDLGLFPRAAAGVATYSAAGVSLTAAAAALAGEASPAGKLPVTIPGPDGRTRYRYGTGLHY
jgi:beta-N-acetylhexosaminidase